ncbi:hypothetical protein NKH99_25430 [Mesorhizobium sp. M0854]|uniref:hypothetical protein n=1 Tax=Mesorhizobium sp. M0854 TaxID=2957013 RepID=UPI00333C498F
MIGGFREQQGNFVIVEHVGETIRADDDISGGGVDIRDVRLKWQRRDSTAKRLR